MADTDLHGQLTAAICEAIPGVELFADKHKTSPYVIVKLNGKTLGYINGKKKLRIQSSRRTQTVLITHPVQIPVALDLFRKELQ